MVKNGVFGSFWAFLTLCECCIVKFYCMITIYCLLMEINLKSGVVFVYPLRVFFGKNYHLVLFTSISRKLFMQLRQMLAVADDHR